MNSLIAIIIALLGIVNIFNARKRHQAEEKLRNLERDHHDEKLKIIENERETSRKRLRDLLDHYRGPGNGKA
jgi:hypothetical protein